MKEGPKFICMGAQKAGTTWLYQQLKNNREFAMPLVKEIHYFDRSEKYPSGDWLSKRNRLNRLVHKPWWRYIYRNLISDLRRAKLNELSWYCKYIFGEHTNQWYMSLFSNSEGLISGDITPSYSFLESQDLQAMRQLVGEIKLVYLIRNPIERAWSMVRMICDAGHTEIEISQLERIIELIDSPGQEMRSNYLTTIAAYRKVFPQGSLLLGFYDAIERDPITLLDGILKHLGAKSKSISSNLANTRFNVSTYSRMPDSIYRHLCEKYRNEIELLAENYGNYCTDWINLVDQSSSGVKSDSIIHYEPYVII